MSEKDKLKKNLDTNPETAADAAEDHAKKTVERSTKRLLGKLRGEAERTKMKPTEYKAGTLHAFYMEKSKSLSEKTAEYRKILNDANIKDIISKNNLLSQEEDTIKRLENNSAGRIAAYTSTFDGEWYTLDYKQVGGSKHELNVGLADVIIDPSVENILIQKGGEAIKAHRDIVQSGQHQGRVGFVNDETGEYIPTFTGDKFQILDNKLEYDAKTTENYMKLYEQEKAAREAFSINYKEISESSFINTGLDLDSELALGNFNQTTDRYAENELNKHGVDGKSVLDYSKKSCQEFGIPYPIFMEMLLIESNFNPSAQNPTSTAGGLGQFIDGTWDRFVQYCNANNIFHKEWGEKPLSRKHKKNPYCSAHATAWLMNQTKSNFDDLSSKPLHHQGVIYYLAHHEGVEGAKKFMAFLEQMKTDGATDFADISKKYSENREEYAKLLDGRQRNLMDKNPKAQMQVYILAKKVGFKAAQSDEKLLAQVRSNIKRFEIREGNSKLSGILKLKAGEPAVFGSSTAVGLSDKTNVFGIGGAGPEIFMKYLRKLWPQIESKKPSHVTLAGLAINGLKRDGTNVEKQLEDYMRIVEFLEAKGVTVEIATLQPYGEKIEAIKAFNKELKTNPKYQTYVIDSADGLTTADNKWKPGMAASDGLHMSDKGEKAFMEKIRKAA